ncbi:hypothetical protein J3R83DRAFT_5269 [Lanmaoa asiatica]|nr:hypothetical protein J3R83DRAFT_5269 [Lanmaoa asiatica]
MSKLPVLTHWEWSPLIHDAFETNRGVIYPPALYWPEGHDSRDDEIMSGLLVVHLRRGDFESHCRYLAAWNSEWNAFNSFPGLPDKYDQAHADPRLSPENREAYMARCHPGIEQIVDKVKTVREESRERLDYLYIMTNAADSWIGDLKVALHTLGGWHHIGSNRDLSLTWEQKYVAQALDMLVAQKAQVHASHGRRSTAGEQPILVTTHVVRWNNSISHGYIPASLSCHQTPVHTTYPSIPTRPQRRKPSRRMVDPRCNKQRASRETTGKQKWMCDLTYASKERNVIATNGKGKK